MPDRELPDGWMNVTLGDCVERITSGATPRAGDKRYYEGGSTPFARIEDVVRANGGRLDGVTTFITEAAVKETAIQVYPAETVLVTMYGTIGATAMTSAPTATNQAIAAFLGPRLVEPKFLLHLLTHLGRRIARLAGQTTQANVSGALLKRFAVTIPESTSEQRRIAEVLDSIDAAIEKTEAVIEATERLRSALLGELLTRGVPGWHTEWRDVPGIGTIPACWEVVRLGEVLSSIDYGTNVPSSDSPGAIPILGMKHVGDGEVHLSGVTSGVLPGNERTQLLLKPGDILFNRTNSIDLVGKVGMVREVAGDLSFASYLLRLRTDPSVVEPLWLIALLNSPPAPGSLRRMATKGASQANINPTSLRSLAIALPPVDEQKRVAGLLETLRSRLESERFGARSLGGLKSALADALLSGRVRMQ